MGERENWNQLGVHGFTGGETCVERGRSGREGRGEEGGREIQEVRGGGRDEGRRGRVGGRENWNEFGGPWFTGGETGVEREKKGGRRR